MRWPSCSATSSMAGDAKAAYALIIRPGLRGEPLNGGSHLCGNRHHTAIEAERLRQGWQTFETNRDRPIIADNGVVSCLGQMANVVLTGSKATKHNQNWQFSVRQGIGEADDDSDIAEGGAA